MRKIFAATMCSMALVMGLAGCSSQPTEEAPEQPQQVEGLTDEASVARAREVMEAFFASDVEPNLTEVDTVSTKTEVDGQEYENVLTTTIMKDVTGEEPKYYKKTETQPASDGDSAYYVDGIKGIVEMNGENVPLEYDAEKVSEMLDEGADTTNMRIYYDCADRISYYEENGTEVVQLQVDPAKLMENEAFSSSFSDISSCIAEYTFDDAGRIAAFVSTVEGTTVGTDGAETPITIDMKCLYANYGTTEVPALPEPTVTEEEAAAETEAVEADSGE